MAGELVIGGGIALLLLMGGKKKKKKSTSGNGGGTNSGAALDEPTEKKKGAGTGGSGGGSQGGSAPSNLAPDAVWVSKDCQKVVFGDGTGEAFWEKKGRAVAQKFISANYHDPYEVAKLMILSMAPCAVEFPVAEDGYEPMEEEFRRELFNRDFKEVYYFIQFLHDKIAELMDKEEFIVQFDDRCDVVFVGENWERPIAERMARFYIGYMYPVESESGHDAKHKTWPLADVEEKHMLWYDNAATAIINRMHPECGVAIVEAFKKEPWSGNSFFSTRPGLKSLYESLTELVNWVDDHQTGGLDFKTLDKIPK